MHLSSLSKTGTSNTLVVCRFGARRAALAAIASDSNFNFPATIGLCAVLASDRAAPSHRAARFPRELAGNIPDRVAGGWRSWVVANSRLRVGAVYTQPDEVGYLPAAPAGS